MTHLFASWLVAAKTTDNPRDCRLVTLAGILPDLDGAGLLVDLGNRLLEQEPMYWYGRYHHLLLHGIIGAVLLAGLLALFARRPWKVAGAAFVVVHLHLLCDLVGARGVAPTDWWPIYYLAPYTREPMWIWHGQWRLDGWPNRLITVLLLMANLMAAVRLGHSVVAVFSRRADVTFVQVLRGWHGQLARRFSRRWAG